MNVNLHNHPISTAEAVVRAYNIPPNIDGMNVNLHNHSIGTAEAVVRAYNTPSQH